MKHSFSRLSLLIALLTLVVNPLVSQVDMFSKKGYQMPPDLIKDFVLAPRHQNISLSNLSPDRAYFLNTIGDGLTPVERLGKPYKNLAGVVVDLQANRARSLTTGGSVGYELIPVTGGTARQIQIPAGARVSSARWSPDGKKIAYFAHFNDATHIYVATVATGRSVKITPRPVLATMNTSFEWSGDSKHILTVLIPEKREPKPQQYVLDNHLRVRVSSPGNTQLRTVLHLLEDSYDEALLEWYGTGQITRINVDNPRQIKNVGKPGLYQSISFAPDGNYLRVTTLTRPFSNIVPVSSFGNVNELWDIDGKVLSEISKRELREGGGTPPTGDAPAEPQEREPQKRSLRWRPDGVGMSYMMRDPAPARDTTAAQNAANARPANADAANQRAAGQGERQTQPRRMDKVYQWLPPYGENDVKVIYETESQITSLDYSDDCQILFITESTGGQNHVYAVFLSEPDKKYTIFRHRTADFYENPGSIMTKTDETSGERVIMISSDGKFVYLSGTKYHQEWKENAPQPFIDRVEIKTGEKSRIFESSQNYFERVISVLDVDMNKVIVSRESPTVIADNYLRDMATGTERKLTNNVDYAGDVTHAQYHRIEIERVDGIRFFANVWLPKDWNGEKLPAMFWFYPSEFTNQEAIDRGKRTTNINSFRSTGIRSMKMLTAMGYAFIEPDFPIVGPTGRMNDFYVVDLQRNWAAIIDACAEKGFIDRSRLALGGHSYGAFGTANSMIHTPYFKAGIAGDGAYNRTLTPMTFQSERRTIWEARETYLAMSPILWAERFNGALLMYHGGDDNNVGTWLINSERMFMALNGLDKPASLYIYPYEDHGPAGKETQLDMWARWIAWLDFYVKNSGKKTEQEEKK